jgi:formylglycine-generating enzyme required for sulfatase activity
MGSPDDEAGRDEDEGPPMDVTVGSFAIGRYPVTFDEWDACVAAGGCNGVMPKEDWGRGRMPVVDVSWHHALAYTKWLSEATGRSCRLPSEAEWEFACRAGKDTAYYWGDEFDPKMANTKESGPGRTTAVGSFAAEPNPWGLHDMSGNVLEWVQDQYHANYADPNRPDDGRAWVDAPAGDNRPRVLRGGSWNHYQVYARCANRLMYTPNDRYFNIGFRVACSSPS